MSRKEMKACPGELEGIALNTMLSLEESMEVLAKRTIGGAPDAHKGHQTNRKQGAGGLHGYKKPLIGEKCAFWFLGVMQINVPCFWGSRGSLEVLPKQRDPPKGGRSYQNKRTHRKILVCTCRCLISKLRPRAGDFLVLNCTRVCSRSWTACGLCPSSHMPSRLRSFHPFPPSLPPPFVPARSPQTLFT